MRKSPKSSNYRRIRTIKCWAAAFKVDHCWRKKANGVSIIKWCESHSSTTYDALKMTCIGRFIKHSNLRITSVSIMIPVAMKDTNRVKTSCANSNSNSTSKPWHPLPSRTSAAVNQLASASNLQTTRMEALLVAQARAPWPDLYLFTWDKQTTLLFTMRMCTFNPQWLSLVMAPKLEGKPCQDFL